MTTTARYSSSIHTRVQFGDRQLPNDCGIVTLAAIVGARLGNRGNYEACAEYLQQHGAYDETGTIVSRLADIIKRLTGSNTRLVRQYKGTTVASYIEARPNWTGVLFANNGQTTHAMPVIDGIVYYTGPNGEWMNADLHQSMRVEKGA